MTRLSLFFPALLWGCGDPDPVPGPEAHGSGTQREAAAHGVDLSRSQRSLDPRVVQVRGFLDAGDLELARAGIEEAAALAGPVEGPLLRARLAVHGQGGELDSLRFLEEARRAAVDDPRVAATTIELNAWTGRLTEAEEELRRAGVSLGSSGRPPEILRAFAVTILCTPGARPREGLALLEEALAADPGLPFTGRALGQAHLLIAKELAAALDFEHALESVRLSREHDPTDLETRRLEAELLVGVGQWGQALVVYEDLLAEGLPLEGEAADLYKRAGFWARVNKIDDGLALRYLRRSLELGLPRSVLGEVESRFLAEAASDEAALAAEDLEAGDLEACERHLDEARLLEPDGLMARYVRGKLYATRGGEGEFEQALAEWRAVVTDARLDGVQLPVPVHIEIARHQVLGMDDLAGALETLDAYLTLEPEGAWVAETRALLEKLPPLPEGESAPGGQDSTESGLEDGR